MVRNLFTVPNLLSLSRIVFAPFVFLLFSIPGIEGKIVLLVFLALLFVTDFFDGMLARKLKMTSDLGRILDPLADKVLIAVLMIALILFRGLPVALVAAVFARDLLILLGGLYIQKTRGKVVESNIWGKLSTALLMVGVLFLVIEDLWYVTVIFIGAGLVCMIISSITYVIVLFRYLSRRVKKVLPAAAAALAVLIAAGIVVVTYPPVRNPLEKYAAEPGLRERTGEAALALAGKYAPVIWLARGESYELIEVAAYLDSCRLVAGRPGFGLADISLAGPPVTETDLAAHNTPDDYLRLDRARAEAGVSGGKYKRTLYAHVMETGDGRWYVQYWFFYLGSEAGNTGLYVHDADWEMIQIECDASGEAVAAGYSAHYYGEVRDWDKVEREGGRPVVYVARGGHGSFFEPGTLPAYFDNNKLLRLGSDTTDRGTKLAPDADYQVVLIDRRVPWVAFKGFWAPPGFSLIEGPVFRNPKNPALAMWTAPDAWMRFYAGK